MAERRRTWAFPIGLLAALVALVVMAFRAASPLDFILLHILLSVLWGLGVGVTISGWTAVIRAARAKEPAGLVAMTAVTFGTGLVPWLPAGLIFSPLLLLFAAVFLGLGGAAGIASAGITSEPWTTGLGGLIIGGGLATVAFGLLLIIGLLCPGCTA